MPMVEDGKVVETGNDEEYVMPILDRRIFELYVCFFKSMMLASVGRRHGVAHSEETRFQDVVQTLSQHPLI